MCNITNHPHIISITRSRSSACFHRNCFTSSGGCTRSGTTITRIPAACADIAPEGASSKATASSGSIPLFSKTALRVSAAKTLQVRSYIHDFLRHSAIPERLFSPLFLLYPQSYNNIPVSFAQIDPSENPNQRSS